MRILYSAFSLICYCTVCLRRRSDRKHTFSIICLILFSSNDLVCWFNRESKNGSSNRDCVKNVKSSHSSRCQKPILCSLLFLFPFSVHNNIYQHIHSCSNVTNKRAIIQRCMRNKDKRIKNLNAKSGDRKRGREKKRRKLTISTHTHMLIANTCRKNSIRFCCM